MTLPRMLVVVGLRLVALVGGMRLLSLPAKWLRPRFYPDGLNGVTVLIILAVLVAVAMYLMVMWVLAPAYNWWEAFSAERQEMIEQLRK